MRCNPAFFKFGIEQTTPAEPIIINKIILTITYPRRRKDLRLIAYAFTLLATRFVATRFNDVAKQPRDAARYYLTVVLILIAQRSISIRRPNNIFARSPVNQQDF